MGERGPGLIGGIAAERPVLATSVLAFAAMALSAVGYRAAEASFASVSIAFLAALFVAAGVPPAIAAAAPKRFWLRAIYAGFAAGILLALRRVLLQAGLDIGPFDEGVALAAAAGGVFILALAAPLWRAAVSYSLMGFAALILGAAGGLAALAVETASGGAVHAPGAILALAASLGAALSVQIAAAFARIFAEGGDNATAAGAAARHASAPALFALGLGVSAIALAAFGAGAPLASILASARVAAAALAFALVVPLVALAGALSLKAETEATAVAENRRRASLRPFLAAVRGALPPSSAIAASAILVILAVVAAFEAKTPASVGETALVSAVAVIAAIVFVSLRTALMASALVAISGRLAAWGVDLAGLAAPTETARVAASALAAALAMQLFLAWRDRRDPRRKTREVVRLALADDYFAYAAAAILSVAAMAASEAAGLWGEGIEAALYALALAFIGFLAAPPLMTAIGALFGRD